MKHHLPKKISAIIATALFTLTLLWAPIVGAQTTSTRILGVMPPKTGDQGELQAKPGEKLQTTIRVRNNSDNTINLRSFAQDFIIKEDGTTPIPVRETTTNRWSLASWMTVAPNKHTLAPKQTAEMAVVIEVPEDALPGGHYAMIVHEPITEAQLQESFEEGSGSAVSQQVGTLFYVKVEGPINEEAYIREFNFKNFQEFGPVPYSFRISNQSDIHIRPSMSIDIFNMIGQKVESLKVESRNIFPLNDRDFAGKWDKVWGLGMYTAKLSATYGDMGQVEVAEANFWIVPIRIILAILFTFFLIIAIIMAVKRHIKHQVQQEEIKLKELQNKLDQYEQKPGAGSEQETQTQTQPKKK